MKLSEYKDEDALDVLADLVEPAAEIFSDKEIKVAADGGNRARAVAVAIKRHKKAVIAIMAALERKPVEEFHCNVLTLPIKLIEILNDPDVMALFPFAGQTAERKPSGSLLENTEGGDL